MAEPYDVVLMDLQMPETDGFEATHAIRQREQDVGVSPTPVVALTARAMKDDEDWCRKAGFDVYLSKPFRTGQLLEALADSVPSAATDPTSVEAVPSSRRLDWNTA